MKTSFNIPIILLLAVLSASCSQAADSESKTENQEAVAVDNSSALSENMTETAEIPSEITPVSDEIALTEMTDLLKLRLGGRIDVDEPIEMPAKGVYQTKFGDRYGYLIENGRYLFIGDLIDLQTAKNFTEIARRDVTVKNMATFSDEDMIIYPAEGDVKETITIFTDTSCPYCKKLHREVAYLTEVGIQVQYLPYPRGSKNGPGYKTLQKVWCAKDRGHAMHVAKDTEVGSLDNDGTCEQAQIVDKGYDVGNIIGVTGTPAIITSSGEKIDGYVPYAQLIPMLLK